VSERDQRALQQQVTLIELVDRVLNRGVVLSGDITLAVAGVDLVYVGLRVLLASVGTLERLEQERSGNGGLLAAAGSRR
jgi:gas vesicle structural protein